MIFCRHFNTVFFEHTCHVTMSIDYSQPTARNAEAPTCPCGRMLTNSAALAQSKASATFLELSTVEERI